MIPNTIEGLVKLGGAINHICAKAVNSKVYNVARLVGKEIESHLEFFSQKTSELASLASEVGLAVPPGTKPMDIYNAAKALTPAPANEKLAAILDVATVVHEELKKAAPQVVNTAEIAAADMDKMLEKHPAVGEALTIAANFVTVK